jgi:hypothetical protein
MGAAASVAFFKPKRGDFQLLRNETLQMVDELTEDEGRRLIFVDYLKSGVWLMQVHVEEAHKDITSPTHEERLAIEMRNPLLEYHGARSQVRSGEVAPGKAEKSRRLLDSVRDHSNSRNLRLSNHGSGKSGTKSRRNSHSFDPDEAQVHILSIIP